MSNKTLELLYAPENGKVINYNVYGNKIFFHVEGGDNAGLYRMNVDGTQLEYVAVGEISGIHCTSRYTFFSYYEDQLRLPSGKERISTQDIYGKVIRNMI